MRKADLFRLVWTNLWRRKVRTVLTTVGVVTGTAAIVAMVSVGVGMQKNLNEQLSSMGAITDITVSPKYDFSGGAFSPGGLPDPVKPLDDAAVRQIRKISGVAAAVPTISLYGTELTFGRYHSQVTVTGVESSESAKLGIKMEAGRYLSRSDDAVIVLGFKLPEQFQAGAETGHKGRKLGGKSGRYSPPQEEPAPFQGSYGVRLAKNRMDLLHKTITLRFKKIDADGKEESKALRVRVIGIMAETGGQEDLSAVVPLQMAGSIAKWRDGFNVKKKGYETVKVRAEKPEMVDDVQREIDRLGFMSFSMKQMLTEVNRISTVAQVLLGGIGGIALLVASFGIMNTMVMSIYERTREIGVLKVIGASVNDVKHLFLLEAGSIGFIGGIIGVLIGWLGTLLVNVVAAAFLRKGGGAPVTILCVPFWLALFGVNFATIVGVLSGLYPALRAARLSPLTAIRQE